jgi:molecular chaperone GrpE
MKNKQELKKLEKDLARLESDIEEKNEELQKKDEEIQKMEDKVEDYNSQLLRLQADFDNYKKRSEKEFKEYVKYANEGLILKVIDAYEDLERALKADQSHDLKEGVEMIHKKLKDILKAEGLCEIDASGDKFDPYKHEALMVEDHDDYDEGIVIEELGKGYTLDS